MVIPAAVTDSRSNPSEQIVHAARALGRSGDRRKVFLAIYAGKKKTKTVAEIAITTHLTRKRVLDEAKKLVKDQIVHQTKVDGDTAYQKDDFFDHNKRKILSLAGNKKKLEQFPTRANPRISAPRIVRVQFLRQYVKAKQITIDDIDSFEKVRGVGKSASENTDPIPEAVLKRGVQAIIGEPGKFQDWGGEKNDLFTTRLRLFGRRRPAAFAFKGKGTRGKLTPKKMGKHGDQIHSLFLSPAAVFLVQYCQQIEESVVGQMKTYAIAASIHEGKTIYFGVVDGWDTARLRTAYPQHFR